MGSTPGDGGTVRAESFNDAVATYFSEESGGDCSKEYILNEIKARPGVKINETEHRFGDYCVKLIK
jgi:hypothetical protein